MKAEGKNCDVPLSPVRFLKRRPVYLGLVALMIPT